MGGEGSMKIEKKLALFTKTSLMTTLKRYQWKYKSKYVDIALIRVRIISLLLEFNNFYFDFCIFVFAFENYN